MNRKQVLKNIGAEDFYTQFTQLHQGLDNAFIQQYQRSLPFSETLIDRWERAKKLNFGEGTSVYDSSFVFGNPKIGKNCWIGPNTIIDATGNLEIGDNCTISSGVHIYTHDNIKKTLSGGALPMEHAPVSIGFCTYIGPQSIIAKGVNIGSQCIIAANSFVNSSCEDKVILAGNPAKAIGTLELINGELIITYFKK